MLPVPGAQVGLDVSHWQGLIDWNAVANATTPYGPIEWVYVKASEGRTVQDPRYLENIKGASAAGLKVGAYHFAWPNKPSSADVGNFIAQLELGRDYLTLPPLLDLEKHPAGQVQPGASLRQWVNDFSGSLLAAGYRKPLLYVGTNYSNKFLDGQAIDLDVWIPQWNRGPLSYTGDEGGPKWLNDTTRNWKVWQFTNRGRIPGIKSHVDVNASRWPMTEFQKGQATRLVDIWALGPGLVYVGFQQRRPGFQMFLIGAGLATIVYNARNYLLNK